MITFGLFVIFLPTSSKKDYKIKLYYLFTKINCPYYSQNMNLPLAPRNSPNFVTPLCAPAARQGMEKNFHFAFAGKASMPL